jgi:hypothetical protein
MLRSGSAPYGGFAPVRRFAPQQGQPQQGQQANAGVSVVQVASE